MPELPEVEALALDLQARLAGREVTKIHVPAFSALKTFDPPVSVLEGLTFGPVRRHGKFLDLVLGGAAAPEPLHLVVHLARGGWIRWREEVPTLPPKSSPKSTLAVRVVNDDQSGLDITEAGTKKRLAAYVVRDPLDVPGIASLGPDPLAPEFTVADLQAILQREGRKQIKGVLRHQGTIAGIGNAYSDELLHAARMSPYKPASSLTDEDVQTLFDAIRTVIGGAVERSRGLAMSELKGEKKSNLAVHGRAGQLCPVCGDVVREVSFADSSLQYCPTCQTGGKPLADRRMSRLLNSRVNVPTVAVSAVPDPLPEGLVVLDVREPVEWAAGHVEGSVHLPMSSLPDGLAELPGDLFQGQTLVVCRVGGRSAQAVGWLAQQGYDVVNLEGGLLEWEAAGRPLVSDGAEPAYVL